MLKISLLALAVAVLLPVGAGADEVRTRTTVHDDGTRTTEIVRESDWETVPVVRRHWGTTGYTVTPRYYDRDVDSSGFPVNPRDGQEVRVSGIRYEWDADDARWEVDE